MELIELDIAREIHPVDVIEQVAHSNDWAFERTGDDEISISVAGNWTDYHVSFSWMEDFEALHLACAFDIKVPEARTLEVMRLLSLINEQMLFGHFDLWEQEGAIMFRQSLLLAGGAEPTRPQTGKPGNSTRRLRARWRAVPRPAGWSALPRRQAAGTGGT